MRILGIDPGIALTGYGVIDESNSKLTPVTYSCISTPAGMPAKERITIIYDTLLEVINEFKPEEVAVEELFFNKNVTSALLVGQARGVVLLAAAKSGLELEEYTPLQVKQALTGYGRADKNQVGEMVKTFLGLQKIPKPDDTADALAIAICHAFSYTMNRRLKEGK